MKKLVLCLLCCLICLCGCAAAPQAQKQTDGNTEQAHMDIDNDNKEGIKMHIQIGEHSFTATLEDNAATRELIQMMKEKPVTIQMNDYAGFEKVGALGRSLPTENRQLTTSPGDIVLYSGNQIVMFYGTNSWSYTPIGKVCDLSGWEEALGSGSVTAVFSLDAE